MSFKANTLAQAAKELSKRTKYRMVEDDISVIIRDPKGRVIFRSAYEYQAIDAANLIIEKGNHRDAATHQQVV